MARATENPKRTKRSLLDDSDSESEDGGAPVTATGFKVNEEFARRFEHNKKREERQRRMDSTFFISIAKLTFCSGGKVQKRCTWPSWGR